MRARRAWIIAHRGASAQAPESTAAAIRLAVALGADMIELDVQMTRDGRLVIFHDQQLARTTNGRGRLARRRYRELARLDSGAWFATRFAGQRILLMSQVLRMVPRHVRLNLELKRTARGRVLVHRVARRLRVASAVGRVLISSFDARLLRLMRAACPGAARAMLCAHDPERTLRTALALGCVAWHPHQAIVTPALVRRAHEAGLRVHVWTVDTRAQARRVVRMGVDGIFTNRPGRLAERTPRSAFRGCPDGSRFTR